MLTRGSVLLARYLVREGKTGTRFAADNDLHQSDVSAYVVGAKGPSRARANLLSKATKGYVTAASWDDVASEVEQRAHAKNLTLLRRRGLEKARAAIVSVAGNKRRAS